MSRVIDAVLKLKDEFTKPMESSLKAMTSMSKQGVRVGKDIEKFGTGVGKVGKDLTKTVTLPILGAAGAAVKTAADFESAMSNVHAIMGKSYDDGLAEFAQHLGATTAWSAQEVAQAMQYTGMAGWTAQENMAGLKGILDLASASGTDLAQTSDIVTDAISAFGYTAADSGRFADVMTAACTSANVSVETLGESYKYCGALAGTMGYELDQVTTALAVMGNNGIKGSQAGTALRSAISNLAAPSADAQKAMSKLGISLKNQDGSMKTFEEVIDNVRGSFSKLGEAEQAAYAKQIFGKQAMAGMLAIVNTSAEEYDNLAASIDASGGAADQAAQTQLNNLNGQLTLLKSAIEGAAIAFGNRMLPYLKQAADWFQQLMDKINGLSDEQMDQIIKWAGIAAAVGPVLIVLGKVIGTVGKGIQIFNKLGMAVRAAGGVMGLLTSPIMIVIGVIAALIAIVMIVRNNWDVFRGSLNAIKPVFESIKGHIQSIIAKFEAMKPTLEAVGAVVSAVLGGVITAAVGGMVGFVTSALDTILGIIDGLMTVLQGVIDFVTGVFTGNWELAWQGVAQIFDGIVSGLESLFTGVMNGIANAINAVIGGINSIKIPDWVPGVGGKSLNIPLLPTLAKGTDDWVGGLVQVHERGGEIIDLPKGSRVYPHDESLDIARREGAKMGGGLSINIPKLADQITIRERADVDYLADQLVRRIRIAANGMGGVRFNGDMA